LSIYSSHNILATAITPGGTPIHVFDYAPDSLPMLLLSIREAQALDLLEIYKPFINMQVEYYYTRVLDEQTGMVRDERFSSMKDNFRRHSSCYDNCMLAMLKDELAKLKIENPFGLYDFRKVIIDNFWNGKYFFDDMKKEAYLAGDANTFPFWCNVVDEKLFSSCLKAIRKEGLDKPFPLKYTIGNPRKPVFPLSLVLPDYETNTQWLHLGLCFLEIVKRNDTRAFKKYMDSYTMLIEKHRNLLEVFNPDGTVFKRRLYACDESMIWAAKFLELSESY
jgi:hypothetical protein